MLSNEISRWGMETRKGRMLLTAVTLLAALPLHMYLSLNSLNHYLVVVMSALALLFSWQVGKYIDRLRYERDTDPLTRTHTRPAALRLFRAMSKKSIKANHKVAVYFIDIDNFKTINDSYGHHVGDTMLKKVSSQLLQIKIRGKRVARWGGDEFVIMVPCADDKEVQIVQHTLLSHIQLPTSCQQTPLSISIGCSTFPSQGISLNELVDIADKQMLWNKRQSKSDAHRKRTATLSNGHCEEASSRRCVMEK